MNRFLIFDSKDYMRLIFILLFGVPFLAKAQDCKLKKEPDPLSNKFRLSTGFHDYQGLSLSIDADSKEIDFFFLTGGGMPKCYDENSTATFVFEGGKMKSEIRNSGSMNCDGAFHLIFKNLAFTPSQLQKFATKKIISITLKGNDKPLVINLTPEDQVFFQAKAACMATEAKTLL
jgi:hypothetical protein